MLCLVAAKELYNNDVRAVVLTALASHRPEVVLAATPELADNWSRAKVLAALALYQPEAVLAAAPEIHDHEQRAQVLVALAPHVPQQERELVLNQAWMAARECKGPGGMAHVFASLAPLQPEAVLAATPELADNWSRAHVLAALAPYRPDAVLATAQSLDVRFRRSEMLLTIAPHLSRLSLRHLYSIWHSTLRHLSTDIRKELMDDLSLPESIAVIEKLGQERALKDMLHAVEAVTTWWP